MAASPRGWTASSARQSAHLGKGAVAIPAPVGYPQRGVSQSEVKMTNTLDAFLSITPMKNLPSISGGDAGQPLCVANISDAERRKRLNFGIIELVIGFAILTALMVLHVAPLWRIALLPIFIGAGIGFFQWRDRT